MSTTQAGYDYDCTAYYRARYYDPVARSSYWSEGKTERRLAGKARYRTQISTCMFGGWPIQAFLWLEWGSSRDTFTYDSSPIQLRQYDLLSRQILRSGSEMELLAGRQDRATFRAGKARYRTQISTCMFGAQVREAL
jgi:hypothetical protein